MKNSLEDLHNHLFAQLERLSDESVKGDALKEEISRARAVSEIARGIVENGNLALKAQKMQGDGLIKGCRTTICCGWTGWLRPLIYTLAPPARLNRLTACVSVLICELVAADVSLRGVCLRIKEPGA